MHAMHDCVPTHQSYSPTDNKFPTDQSMPPPPPVCGGVATGLAFASVKIAALTAATLAARSAGFSVCAKVPECLLCTVVPIVCCLIVRVLPKSTPPKQGGF